MARVQAAPGNLAVSIDNGVTVTPYSSINVDINLPLAAAALLAGKIIQLDSATPPTTSPASLVAPVVQLPRHPITTPVTGFQTGHGFFLSAPAGATLTDPDTSAFINGGQSVTMKSDGAGGPCYLKKNSIAPVLDFTGKMVRVWLRLPNPADIANLSSVLLYLGSDNVVANYFGFTTLMSGFGSEYYGNETARFGWMGVTMSFGEQTVVGAPARNSINSVWLKVTDAHGQPVQVGFGGVEMVPEPANGVVSFTFDDGRLTQFTQARAKLSQYRFPASAYIIRETIGANPVAPFVLPGVPSPYYMNTEQLDELQMYHGWEIGAHADTLAVHNLPNSFVDVSGPQVDAELQGIRSWLLAHGYRGDTLALPKGKHNQTIYDLVRKYFQCTRGTYSSSTGLGWLKHETWPPTDRNKLVCFYVMGTTTLAQMEAAVDSAFANKEWLIFVFHDLVAVPDTVNTNTTQAKLADFNSLVDYIATKGIPVRTISDVINHGV